MRITANKILLLLAGGASVLSATAPAAPATHIATPLILAGDRDSYDAAPHLAILEDADGTLSLSEAMAQTDRYAPLRTGCKNFGLTDSVFWAKLTIDNSAPDHDSWLLSLDYPMMQNFQVYLPRPDGTYEIVQSGAEFPASVNTSYIVPAILPRNAAATLFFRFETAGTMRFPMTIATVNSMLEHTADLHAAYSFNLAFLLVTAGIGLVLFGLYRDRTYVYFALTIIAYICFYAIRTGFGIGNLNFYRHTPALNLYVFFSSCALAFAILFTGAFLKIGNVLPRLTAGVKISALLGFVVAAAGLLLPPSLMISVLTFFGFFGLAVCLSLVIVSMPKKDSPSQYLFVPMLMLFAATALYALAGRGVLPSNPFILKTQQLGFALFTVTLLAAIVVRLRITIREAKETEALRREKRMLQRQKMESLGALAGGIAHDFNNHLMVILGNLELAQAEIPPRSQASAALNNAAEAVNKSSALADQMLAYAGKRSFAMEKIDLAKTIADTASLLEAAAGEHVSCKLALAHRMPPVNADPGQIQQVLINLVANAAEAMDNAQGTVTIAVGTSFFDKHALEQNRLNRPVAPGDYAYVKVADCGEGMDQAVESRIFEPFFSTKFIGRGLGLSVVTGIVEKHHGAILLDTAKGKGTVVTILLPLANMENTQTTMH